MFLERIIELKKERIQKRKGLLQQREMEEIIPSLPPPKDLMGSITQHPPIAVIAEIKRASPSLGMIKEEVDILQLAKEYEKGGATGISVLTEEDFFKGHLSYLQLIKEKVSIPILQKDFILDPFQIYEGRVAGADAVLLIAAILDQNQLKDFVDLIQGLHMVPLVEIHNEEELEKVSNLDLPLIGINNRDLRTFEVDLRTSLRLRKKIPSAIKVISESGIKSSEEVKLLKWAGFDGILIGEVLMRSPDPSSKIRELMDIWSG